MPARFVDFGWSVCSSGYEWRDVRNGDTVRNLLVPKLTNGTFAPKPYNPCDSRPDLFRLFCKMEITKVTMVEFADRYGLLGWAQESGFDSNQTGLCGESLAAWKEAHVVLRSAVRLWDALQVRDVRALNNQVRFWFRGKMYYLRPYMRRDRTYVEHYGPNPQEDTPPPDLMGFAEHLSLNPRDKTGRTLYLLTGKVRGFLQYTVNLMLRHLTRTALLWDSKQNCAIHIVPHNLLGAMWLQLAVDMTTLGESPKCQNCGEYFIAKRAKGAEYCSTRCRVSSWRARQGKNAESA